jgi:hypothetical protein
VALKAKTIGTLVVILVLAVGSIIAYNWKAITPPAVQTTTARTGPTMIRIKIPDNGCYLGSYIDGAPPINSQQIRAFEQMVGKRLAIMCMNYVGQDGSDGRTTFPSDDLGSVYETGSIPMIGWYPILKDKSGKAVPTRLQDVIDGNLDVLIRDWASNTRLLGSPIFVRLGWEMNIQKSYWGGATNFGPHGNQTWDKVDNLYTYYGDPKKPDGPERYVDAWRHIHNIFENEGTKNAIWVWCPHHRSDPDVEWNKPENYYPGDEYVDWVGCDLYNGGYVKRPAGRLMSFDELFRTYYGTALYRQYQNKPFILAEVGCLQNVPADVSGDKASWIRDAYDSIRNLYPNIKAVCWFSKDKRASGEQNWRVDSSQESLEAYRKTISDPYFLDRIMFESGGSTAPSAVLHSAIVASTVGKPSSEKRLKR